MPRTHSGGCTPTRLHERLGERLHSHEALEALHETSFPHPRPLPSCPRLRTPPSEPPDAHSYSIALTAVRAAALAADEGSAERGRGGAAARRERRESAARLLQRGVEAGTFGGAGASPSGAVAHSAITACGGDVAGAISLWREIRPLLRSWRREASGGAEEEAAAEAERAAAHALLRVCGIGGPNRRGEDVAWTVG